MHDHELMLYSIYKNENIYMNLKTVTIYNAGMTKGVIHKL